MNKDLLLAHTLSPFPSSHAMRAEQQRHRKQLDNLHAEEELLWAGEWPFCSTHALHLHFANLLLCPVKSTLRYGHPAFFSTLQHNLRMLLALQGAFKDAFLKANNFWTEYENDIKLTRDLGATSFRFSFEVSVHAVSHTLVL
jgi:hypothetical protein